MLKRILVGILMMCLLGYCKTFAIAQPASNQAQHKLIFRVVKPEWLGKFPPALDAKQKPTQLPRGSTIFYYHFKMKDIGSDTEFLNTINKINKNFKCKKIVKRHEVIIKEGEKYTLPKEFAKTDITISIHGYQSEEAQAVAQRMGMGSIPKGYLVLKVVKNNSPLLNPISISEVNKLSGNDTFMWSISAGHSYKPEDTILFCIKKL